jgi:hypothetical protein
MTIFPRCSLEHHWMGRAGENELIPRHLGQSRLPRGKVQFRPVAAGLISTQPFDVPGILFNQVSKTRKCGLEQNRELRVVESKFEPIETLQRHLRAGFRVAPSVTSP